MHGYGPGTRVGEYVIEREVARGGYGTVFRARSRSGAPVALKLLDPVESNRHVASRLFSRELEAALRLDTPHVAKVLDADLVASPPWIAYAFLHGQTLADRVRSGRLPKRLIRNVFRGVAEGLEAIHAAGIVHRDVSPDNIMVTRRGGILVDLGIASLGKNSRYTAMQLGKEAFQAPEQWLGKDATAATDMWQFGVSLVKASAGRLPFPLRATPTKCSIQWSRANRISEACLRSSGRSSLHACRRTPPGGLPPQRPGGSSAMTPTMVQ